MTAENSDDDIDHAETSAEADMGLGLPPMKKNTQKEPRTNHPARRGDDPSEAPEEEGSATQISNNQQLLNEHHTDESGAPDDD